MHRRNCTRNHQPAIGAVVALLVLMTCSAGWATAQNNDRDGRGNILHFTDIEIRYDDGNGFSGLEELLRRDLHHRDMRVLNNVLELDVLQQPLAEMLLERYITQFDEAAEELRDALRRLHYPGMSRYPYTVTGESPRTVTFTGEIKMVLVDTQGEPVEIGGDVDTIVVKSGAIMVTGNADENAADDSGVDAANSDTDPAAEADPEALAEGDQALAITIEDIFPPPTPTTVDKSEEQVAPGELLKLANDFRHFRRQLRAAFDADLRLILNDRQRTRLPEFDRRLGRLYDLPRGRLSGESFDVMRFARFESQSLHNISSLQLLLEQHANRLEVLLEQRNAMLIDHELEALERIADAVDAGESGELPEAWQSERMRELVDLRTTIRDHNLATLAQIEATLPDDEQAAFRDEARTAAFPRIFRPSSAERAIKNAQQLDDLSEETAAAITTLLDQYRRERRSLNEKYLAATLDYEPIREREQQWGRDYTRKLAERLQIDGPAGSLDDLPRSPAARWDALRNSRRAQLWRTTVELSSLLTAEQYERAMGRPKRLQVDPEGGWTVIQPAER